MKYQPPRPGSIIFLISIIVLIAVLLAGCDGFDVEITFQLEIVAPDSILLGDDFTAEIKVSGDSGVPTGKYDITDSSGAGCMDQTLNANGNGSCQMSSSHLSAGPQTITGKYYGDENYREGTVKKQVNITTQPTIVFVLPTPNSALIDEEITAAIKVSGASGTPIGKVDILNGDGYGCKDLTLDSEGSASCQVSITHIPNETIHAKYYGDEYYSEVSETYRLQVDKFTSVVTITSYESDFDPPILDDYIDFTIQVTGGAPFPPQYAPTGTVMITGDRVSVYTQPSLSSDGTAEVTAYITSIGPFTVIAEYSGDVFNSSAVSDPMSFTAYYWQDVNLWYPSPDFDGPLLPNEPIDVVVYVLGGGPAPPTGSLTLTADTSCTAPLTTATQGEDPGIYEAIGDQFPGYIVKGTCPVSFTSSRDGALITAAYPGDSNYHSQTASVAYDMTDWIDSTTTITGVLPETLLVGEWVTVVVEVEAGGGPPEGYGYVTITGADTTCIIYLADGQDRCSVMFNTKGTKTLIATYSGFSGIHPSQDTRNVAVIKLEPTEPPE